MKGLAFLVLGFAAGYVVAHLSREWVDCQPSDTVGDIKDEISDRLKSLESSLETA